MQADIFLALLPYIEKALVAAAFAGVGALLMSPFKKARQEWSDLRTQIASAQRELVHQRTNCLATLQNQGDKQIDLLTKAVETLEAMHLDQKETLGYIRSDRN